MMKIVQLQEFLAMPVGTIFDTHEVSNFGGMEIVEYDFKIKGPTTNATDFTYLSFQTLPLDPNGWVKVGGYRDDTIFAVWESADLASLLALTQPSGQAH